MEENKVIGFMFTQPLHKTLRQMRLATIALLAVSCDIMYRLVDILEAGTSLSPGQTTAAVATLAAAVFAALWKGISNLAEPHRADDA